MSLVESPEKWPVKSPENLPEELPETCYRTNRCRVARKITGLVTWKPTRSDNLPDMAGHVSGKVEGIFLFSKDRSWKEAILLRLRQRRWGFRMALSENFAPDIKSWSNHNGHLLAYCGLAGVNEKRRIAAIWKRIQVILSKKWCINNLMHKKIIFTL
jgi:hypothetical protein